MGSYIFDSERKNFVMCQNILKMQEPSIYSDSDRMLPLKVWSLCLA